MAVTMRHGDSVAGRPLTGQRMNVVQITLHDAELAAIDGARGEVPRAAFIRTAALGRASVTVAVTLPGRNVTSKAPKGPEVTRRRKP